MIISLSVLGYEGNLDEKYDRIDEALEAGVEELHVDIMRHPFILNGDSFSRDKILKFCCRYMRDNKTDFHLMVNDPRDLIDYISGISMETNITVHREAFRSGLGKYNRKEYDLLVKSGDSELDGTLRRANVESGDNVKRVLEKIKREGLSAGVALEPGTSLENLDEDMLGLVDRVLLMGVCSGAGGQKYDPSVTAKIKQAKEYGVMVQVDGGINDETIESALEAGADNLVIGSYITGNDNPGDVVRGIISRYS